VTLLPNFTCHSDVGKAIGAPGLENAESWMREVVTYTRRLAIAESVGPAAQPQVADY